MMKVILGSPLLVVILVLLSSADSIFLKYVNEIPELLWEIDLGEIPIHILLITLVSSVLFAYFWSLHHPQKKEEPTAVPSKAKEPAKIDGVIAVTILSMLNLVYVGFTFIQISFLFADNAR